LQPYPDPVGAVPVSPEHPRVMKNPQGSFEISVENFAQKWLQKSLGALESPLYLRGVYAAEV
jgi:hypothetical protein